MEVESSLLPEAELFLNFLSDYILASERIIKAGETLRYGYWLVQFREAGGGEYLEVVEYSADASTFTRGCNLTLSYWKDQHRICDQQKAAFHPPRPDRLTVVSEGVFEGLAVQGVRYPSPDHMSGWWITTDLYDGNISSLRLEHTHHVTAARPDLARYLALPDGFRFNPSATDEVWFDEEASLSKV